MADLRAILSVSGPDLPTDQIEVGKGKFTIGRVPENNLPLNSQKISRRHADIVFDGEGFTVEDLESSNGTLVNGIRIDARKPTRINVGDSIGVGPFTLTVISIDLGADAPPATPVQVLQPEAPTPTPAAPPPVGAPQGEEEPPAAVFVSAPPPSPNEAPTVEPQRTAPADKAKAVQDKPKEDTSKAIAVSKPRPIDSAMTGPPPPRTASTNGHRSPVPLGHIRGIPLDESRYMQYLPGVFHDSDFLKRYLLIEESILAPLEWGIDSFEQFYNPNITTPDWLQWIGWWFDVLVHPSVPLERQRAVVRELGFLYRARGTRRAMTRLLELYFGVKPEITEPENTPSAFKVKLPLPKKENTALNRALAEQLITVVKPAHTSFTLDLDD